LTPRDPLVLLVVALSGWLLVTVGVTSGSASDSRSNEAEGSSWTPIIDGALTPQLLEHERIFDLERFKGDLERGHRREFSTELRRECAIDDGRPRRSLGFV
jgi:hypothetical protein